MTPNQIVHVSSKRAAATESSRWLAATRPRDVTQVVARWAGAELLPNGRLAYAILKDLSEEIGADVVPGIRRPATEQ